MRPGVKRRAIRDAASRSLYLVVHPSGQKSWLMRFRTPSGRVAKMVIGSVHVGPELDGTPVVGMPLTLVAARQLAAEIYRRRAMGEDVIEQHKARRARRPEEVSSFGHLARKFIEQHARPNTKGWRETARLLGLNYPDDGQPPTEIAGGLAQRWNKGTVTEHDVFAAVEEARAVAVPGIEPKREGTTSELRAIVLAAALSSAFGWLKKRRLIDVNPMLGISRPKPPEARDRVCPVQRCRSSGPRRERSAPSSPRH